MLKQCTIIQYESLNTQHKHMYAKYALAHALPSQQVIRQAGPASIYTFSERGVAITRCVKAVERTHVHMAD
jgi:hypothetical protein